jgi:N-acyl-D-amino-acid deacylase
MLDLIIRGGWVLDGTGAPAMRADVGVRGDRVATVGRLDAVPASVEIDAAGRYVTPGLIDAHVHADAAIFEPDVQLALLRQGVTTVVLGQDGLSFAPGSPSTVEHVSRYFAAVNGPHPALPDGPVSVAALLAGYTGATPVNAAYLVPHGTIRYEVMGAAARPAQPEELARMRQLVEAGLADGAVGLSSGLEYAPGRYADAAELGYLCAPLGGLPYVTHMRGYESRAAIGMAEATAIGRLAGVAVHVSHYHGPVPELVGMVDTAREGGLDLTFDSYPYLRGSSILALVTLPDWLPTADLPAATAALREPSVRDRLHALWSDQLWPRVTLSYVDHPEWAWTEGLRLPEAAAGAGLTPADLAIELLVATELRVGCVFEQPPTASDESLRTLLRHPAHLGGSDGIYRGGHPHPRGFGAFARLLGRHVRELDDWSWEQAIVHLAGHPARRFGLADRGLLRPGHAADIVLLDPATIADRASYPAPRQLAEGVSDVVVNGVAALRGGTLTGARPGRGLTP